MSETVPSAPPSPAVAASPRPRFQKLRIAIGMLPEPDGRPPYIWLERWDALIIGSIIAVGVPLLGLSGFPPAAKMLIAAVWFAVWSPFFAYFEGRELIGQMIGRGAIKQEQLSEQQNTAQDPFYGTIFAVVVWLVVYAVHVASQNIPHETTWSLISGIATAMYHGLQTTPVNYGPIEWLILIQAWLVTKYLNYIFYNVGNTFSKAAPMGERTERTSR